jgi:MFS family permease
MALTNLAVFGGAFFTPILVGKITHTIGWPWTFYFVAIFTAACFPLMFFYVPETSYRRSAHLNTDMTSSEEAQRNAGDGKEGQELRTSEGGHVATQNEQVPTLLTEPGAGTPKKSSGEMLQIFSGTYSDVPAYILLARPFPLFAHPAVLWACIIQGAMIGWTVFIGIILAAIFLGPPLYWNEVNTGYAYTGAFIGAIVGFLIAGALADVSAKWMTKKNNGIYEPEFRIILVIPQLIFGCAGLFLFSVTAARLVDYPWVLPVLAFGMQVGGMVIGAVAASLYIVDAHRKSICFLQRHFTDTTLGDIAIEAFTCILIFKVCQNIHYSSNSRLTLS